MKKRFTNPTPIGRIFLLPTLRKINNILEQDTESIKKLSADDFLDKLEELVK